MTSNVLQAAVWLSSAVVLSILLKATLLLALGLTSAWLAKRARASVRHVLLAATFAMLLALPLLVLAGPALSIEVPVAVAGGIGAVPNMSTPTGAAVTQASSPSAGARAASVQGAVPRPSWSTLFFGTWAAGAILLASSLAFNLWRVRRIVRNGLPWIELHRTIESLAADVSVRGALTVLRHEDVAAPFMCGLWKPTIVLPAAATDWDDEDVTRALIHELEHVRRRDWAIQCAARLACACYWFHPLVWIAWRRLCLEAERACDDAVVQRAEGPAYAEQLVVMAQRLSKAGVQPLPGMANRSDLAGRVGALLDATQRRGRAGTPAIASAIAAAVLFGALIAPVRAVAVSPRRAASVEASAPTPAPAQAPDARVSLTRPSRLDAALYEAATQGDVRAIASAIDEGANVNAAIGGDGSPLIGAAREGHLDAVRLLLDRGANIDMGVGGDGNPLIMAARDGHENVVALLLDRGANVNHAVPGDENALIQASSSGHLDVVRLLVGHGANVNARIWAPRSSGSGEWRTPLSMARKHRHAAVVEYLQSAGASQ